VVGRLPWYRRWPTRCRTNLIAKSRSDHVSVRLAQNFQLRILPPDHRRRSAKLQTARQQLTALRPAYFSVTYGAGGSTRDRTVEVVLDTQAHSGVPAAPHLTCIASTRNSIRELLNHYKTHGIRRIVALRGDMPSGMRDPGEFRYANELVGFIRTEFGDHFHIEVAAYPEYHPQASSPAKDLENFQRKVDAGANSAITQYFYNSDAYFRFVDHCAGKGADIPIVPGIMPITNFTQLARFSDACGAEIPAGFAKRWKASATTATRFAPLVWMWSANCAENC
jgi:methylenetetrahydrofolate reductase (NADPH)